MVDNCITIRPFRPGDEKDINNLFNKIFHNDRRIDGWKWKFVDNPASGKVAEWVTIAEKEGRIVGHYASLAIDMQFGNTVIKAGQPVDTMIDPLAKVSVEYLRKLSKEHVKNNKEIALFGFGFPNEVAYKIGKRFWGYQDLGKMLQFFKRLSLRSAVKRRFPQCPAWLLRFIHRVSQNFCSIVLSLMIEKQDYFIEEIKVFDKRIDGLWDELKSSFKIITIRNRSYLNWKYGNKHYTILIYGKNDEISGYVVLRINNAGGIVVGYIVDILSKEGTYGEILIKTLHYFIKQEVDYVLCGCMEGSQCERHLEAVGFIRHEGFQSFPVVCTPISPQIDRGYLLQKENWYLTFGDIDGFCE